MPWPDDRERRSKHLFARVTADEMALFREAAAAEEREFADWIRRTLRARAEEIARQRLESDRTRAGQ